MKLYCVRHGTTPWTEQNRYTGTSNPELTDFGLREARAIADHLKETSFDHIVSSPLSRCFQTCEVIADVSGQRDKVIQDMRAQEIHYGTWEGHTRDEILAEDPEAFKWWDTDPTQQAPPSGESVESVRQRLTAMLEELLAADHQQVLLVSHRTVLRVLLAQALAMPLSLYRQRLDHSPAALTILEMKKPDDAKLLLCNFKPSVT